MPDVLNDGQDAPTYDEQQATASGFAYDNDPNDADQAVDGLISGLVWDQTALTYSFPTGAADYEVGYYDSAAIASVSGLNATQISVVYDTVDQFAAVSGLTFTELGDDANEQVIDADLRFAKSNNPSTAYAYYPSDNTVGGDAFYNTNNYNSPVIGNYQYATFLHELGHGLGLKHGHDTSGPGAIPYEQDSMEYSIMTYRSWVGKPLDYGYANETWGYAQSLQMLDIAAIQRMYGANFTTNATDTTYTFSTQTGEMFVDGVGVGTPGGNRVFRTIWDGDGEDTYDFSNYSTSLNVDLTPGEYVDLDTSGNFQRAKLDFGYNGNPVTYSRGHVFNAMQHNGDARSLIENANGGSGNDTFIGNAADNIFQGNDGNDTFIDSAGEDTYLGGQGVDEVVFDALFGTFTFEIAGTFLKAIDVAVDWVENTVENFVFTDATKTWTEIAGSLGSNAAPTAFDDSASGGENAVIVGNVLTNDSDPDGDAIVVSAVNGNAGAVGGQIALSSGALLTVNADGSFSYDTNGAFDGLANGASGNDSFIYEVSDGLGGFDTAMVNLTISSVNDNPDAVDDAYATATDQPLVVTTADLLVNDSDVDGDTLSVVSVQNAQNGTVSLGGGSVTFTPTAGFTGTGSFTYTIDDGFGGSDTATATVSVSDPGTLAVIGQAGQIDVAVSSRTDTINVAFDQTIQNAVVVLAGTQNGGHPITLRVVDVTDTGFSFNMEEWAYLDGSHTALESVNWVALQAGAYQLADGRTIEVGTVNADHTGATVNFQSAFAAGPVVVSSVMSRNDASPLDSDAINISAAGFDLHVEEEEGSADGGVHGTETFGYIAVESGGADTTSGVALTQSGITHSAQTIGLGVSFTDLVSIGDTQSQNETDTATLAVDVVNGSTVSVRIVEERSGDYELYHDAESVGVLAFESGAIEATSLSGNLSPVAMDDSASGDENAVIAGNVLANDSDADGDPLSVTEVNGSGANVDSQFMLASGALLTLNADGSFSYDTNNAFDDLVDGETASDSFTYGISDGNGGSDTATVDMTINGIGTVTPTNVAIDFEGEADGSYAGVAGLNFSGAQVRSGTEIYGSKTGTTGADGSLSILADGLDFDFEAASFRLASGRADIVVSGYDDGVLVGSETFKPRPNETVDMTFGPGFQSVDEVTISAGQEVYIDDLSFITYS